MSNYAQSGLALHSFERQRRLEKVLGVMRKGDHLFVQFGHNDQKDKSPGAGPFTTYKANLKRYVAAVRGTGSRRRRCPTSRRPSGRRARRTGCQ